jgi:integrase
MRDLDYHRVVTLRAALSRPKANGDKPAPSSIKRTMWVLNAICDYACKRNLISENPCAKLDKIKGRKPVKKMPTTEDVERLFAALSSPTPERKDKRGRQLQERPADPRYPLLVETAAYSGLRAGELAGLQVRDLNVFNRSISVVRTVIALPGEGLRLDTPKSDAGTRTVTGLDSDLIDRLRVHCSTLSPRDYVFGSRDDEGKTRPLHVGNTYRRVIKPAAEALGIDMTFHGLRHHYASLLIDLGLNPVEVTAQLGHESAAFTLRTYAHLFKQDGTDVGDEVARRRAAARGEDTMVTRLRFKRPF